MAPRGQMQESAVAFWTVWVRSLARPGVSRDLPGVSMVPCSLLGRYLAWCSYLTMLMRVSVSVSASVSLPLCLCLYVCLCLCL